MRIVVIGAGAIGGYVGGKLALGGHDVTLIGRSGVVEAIKMNGGLRVLDPSGEHLARVRAVTNPAQAFSDDESDLVLFTVKGYDTQAAVRDLTAYAKQFALILSLQNGVTSEFVLAEAFGAEKVLAGTTTHPVSVLQPGVVRSEKKRGGIVIAPFAPTRNGASVNALREAFTAVGIVMSVADDAQSVKWSKLLLNILGNATSAILDMDTRQIYSNPKLVSIEIDALREGLAVVKAKGIKLVDLPGYPVRLLALAVRHLPTSVLQPVLKAVVTKGRAEKLPSLLIDMRRETGKSEIADLNGAIVRAGQEAKVPTPANKVLATTLSLLVSDAEQRKLWRHQPEQLVAAIRTAQHQAESKPV